ncbi:MAG: methyltransferase domain-containing protein [Magnetococcales bacterium]|nr:methyltransferase domain-containing protein [Magnetococcales bacterium]
MARYGFKISPERKPKVNPDRDKWNERYRQSTALPGAARVLIENKHLLPPSGLALDLACGLGGNALLLAELGFQVEAWDISDVAVKRLQQESRKQKLPVKAQVRNLTMGALPDDHFDIIVVSRFLERGLAPCIIKALRPGGVLFYQTFIRARVGEAGPESPIFRLKENELLHLFDGLTVLAYREEGLVGDLKRGFRDEAQLVARKNDSNLTEE